MLLGLPRSTSNELVVQTLVGAAKMLRETGEHPTVLRENVTSPAGTTVAALRQLDDHKVRAAFLSAMEAARDRSRELADGLTVAAPAPCAEPTMALVLPRPRDFRAVAGAHLAVTGAGRRRLAGPAAALRR